MKLATVARVSAALGLLLMFMGVGLGSESVYQPWMLWSSLGLIVLATVLMMRLRPGFIPDRWGNPHDPDSQ